MNKNLLKTCLATGLLLAVSLACASGSGVTGLGNSNLRIVMAETPLDRLKDSQRLMVFVDVYSSHQGIYWLDLDHHTLYLATTKPKVTSSVDGSTYPLIPLDFNMTTWNGRAFIYGSRVHGFYALAPDGGVEKRSDVGYVGSLADNGAQILRFSKCGPDEQGSAYEITPLDRLVGEAGYCFGGDSSGADWVYVNPVWNPHLPRVDFIVSERNGRGDSMVVKSTKLLRPLENGEMVEVADLGADFKILECCLHPRPDGEAFYIANSPSGTFRVVDGQGRLLSDLNAASQQFPELEMSGQLSWAPDSRQAILVFKEKGCQRNCARTLVHASDDFKTLKLLVSLPEELKHAGKFAWSPDSVYVALYADNHDGSDYPPRILTINLQDGSTKDYILPTFSILRDVRWVR
jgi:hypothetical protein